VADHISEAKQMKIEQVAVIKEKLEKAQSVVLVEYKGITVAQDTKLRAQCRANNVEYKVLKNRLVKKALEQLGIEGFDKALEETTAFAFGYDDCVTPAKVIADNAKEIKCLNIKCGLVEGAFADKATIEKLASSHCAVPRIVAESYVWIRKSSCSYRREARGVNFDQIIRI